jgi:hypothetical protein
MITLTVDTARHLPITMFNDQEHIHEEARSVRAYSSDSTANSTTPSAAAMHVYKDEDPHSASSDNNKENHCMLFAHLSFSCLIITGPPVLRERSVLYVSTSYTICNN